MTVFRSSQTARGSVVSRNSSQAALVLAVSLKSPRRIASVGTVAVLVATWKKFTHSCAPKKNSLSRKISPGTGPPTE